MLPARTAEPLALSGVPFSSSVDCLYFYYPSNVPSPTLSSWIREPGILLGRPLDAELPHNNGTRHAVETAVQPETGHDKERVEAVIVTCSCNTLPRQNKTMKLPLWSYGKGLNTHCSYTDAGIAHMCIYICLCVCIYMHMCLYIGVHVCI